MNKRYPVFLLLFAAIIIPNLTFSQLNIQHISTYSTGIFDEGAAEIAAHDPGTQRVFVTNADNKSVDILDIADINNPVLIGQIDITTYGDGINSVASAKGMVATAIENEIGTAAGKIVLFDIDGNYVAEYPAGVLPDMVTFSPDGNYLLCANEGEPDDDYLIDPEGSVTLIDLSAGAAGGVVTQIDFKEFNDKKMSLKNKGIRIFGPGATVAQDLEPEYITVSEDNMTAYIGCQENNALLVIDLATAMILDILPLGTKDHWRGEPDVNEFLVNKAPGFPDLGQPIYGGDVVKLGGFSGLWYDAQSSNSYQQSFYTIPDRGPNDSPVSKSKVGTSQNLRPFKLPNYQARIVKLNLIGENIYVDANPIMLTQKDGITPITGRGNIPGFDEVPVTQTDSDVYTKSDYSADGISYHELEYDPYGGDFEGIVKMSNGDFWMCDEYRPSIYHFNSNGVLVERYVPEGTSRLGTAPQPAGTYGAETLPAVYSKRRANRGFEALAYDSDENIMYAFIQTPMYNPGSGTKNNSDIIRILGINPVNGQPIREYVYLLERNREPGIGLSRVDKIGDAVYLGNGKFAILERDSSTPGAGITGKKYVFEINIKGATNILGTALSQKSTSTGDDDKTLEMMTADDLAAAGIKSVFKMKMMNLPSVGYHPSDKPEGLAVTPQGELFVLNDNDFGLAGAGVTDDISLARIGFKFNWGFDASDKSGNIDIRPRKTMGMFMPDAISSATIGGKNYVFTANEGDARDYDGYSEEGRVDDLTLDESAYPWPSFLQNKEDLGRLKTTFADGDQDGDGDVDQIYSYGTRSFSIWDENGNLVFDSGADFEIFTSIRIPGYFNSQGDDRKKNRSDDKGPEPEAIDVAEINGQFYAFIALERVGGFMVYNVTNPYTPYFVDYVYNRDFSLEPEQDVNGDIAPECIFIIDAQDSPTGTPVAVTSSEVSGTVSFFDLYGTITKPSVDTRSADMNESPITMSGVFPNPFDDKFSVGLHLMESADAILTLTDMLGRNVGLNKQVTLDSGFQTFRVNDLSHLPAGTYHLKIQTENSVDVKTLLKK